MKFRRPKQSTTYKTHFFSALCRAIFVNGSQILVNTLFVKTVGARSYSQLYFFAGVAALLYFVYFLYRGHNAAFSLYKVVLGFSLLVSALCCFAPFWPELAPFNQLLLYFFAVSVNVVDLIGPTLGPAILQWSVNPAIFREVYARIVAAELLARISAAAMVWCFSQIHQLNYCYPITWLVLIIHFILFNVTVWHLRRIERKNKTSTATLSESAPISQTVSQTISKSVRFIASNPLVRAAIAITIWAYSTQFLIEYIFYQTADAKFSSTGQYASFLSALTVIMTVLALLFQHKVGRQLTKRLQLTTLFSFQPINILIFGCAALIVPPFWPLALLMVTYSTINRGVQLPVSRQCLVPVPRPYRATIVCLISILAAVCQLLLSGALVVLNTVMHLQDFLVVLLVLATLVFLLITRLDAYYVRNLWSLYREARSGRWQDEPVADHLSGAELESAGGLSITSAATAAHNAAQNLAQAGNVQLEQVDKSVAILGSYARTYERDKLAKTSHEHRRLLYSGETELTLMALRICFISGFPWLKKVLARSVSHGNVEVKTFVELALQVDFQFGRLHGYTSLFRRRIKALALEFLEQRRPDSYIQRLATLVRLPDHEVAESFLSVLSDVRFRDLRDVLLRCIVVNETSLTLKPIFDYMYASDYRGGAIYRDLLQRLSVSANSQVLLETVTSSLSSMKREDLCLWAEAPRRDRKQDELERFMHTLFLEEYRLYPEALDLAVVDTISEFHSVSHEDSAILIEMHLEWLKKSELFRSWEKLMAR